MACLQVLTELSKKQGSLSWSASPLPPRFKVGFKASVKCCFYLHNPGLSYHPLRLDYLNQSDYAL